MGMIFVVCIFVKFKHQDNLQVYLISADPYMPMINKINQYKSIFEQDYWLKIH